MRREEFKMERTGLLLSLIHIFQGAEVKSIHWEWLFRYGTWHCRGSDISPCGSPGKRVSSATLLPYLSCLLYTSSDKWADSRVAKGDRLYICCNLLRWFDSTSAHCVLSGRKAFLSSSWVKAFESVSYTHLVFSTGWWNVSSTIGWKHAIRIPSYCEYVCRR